jgi:hypothetical protein
MKQYKLVFTEFKFKTKKVISCWELEFDVFDQALWDELSKLVEADLGIPVTEEASQDPEDWFELFTNVFNFKGSSFKKGDSKYFAWNPSDFPDIFLIGNEVLILQELKDFQGNILKKFLN